MNTENRFLRLRKIYELYDSLCDGLQRFCRKGCALCCTANVTLTSLEAELILDYWQAQGHSPPISVLETAAGQSRFRPTMTINRLADLCARDVDVPDEEADPQVGPCPLLENDLCSIYSVRPFGCRAMQSLSDCGREGAADMPEWVLSANTLFLQYIEAADNPGVTDNLADVLLLMVAMGNRHGRDEVLLPHNNMPANRSIPVLMIPPEHRARLQGPAQTLRQIVMKAALK